MQGSCLKLQGLSLDFFKAKQGANYNSLGTSLVRSRGVLVLTG